MSIAPGFAEVAARALALAALMVIRAGARLRGLF